MRIIFSIIRSVDKKTTFNTSLYFMELLKQVRETPWAILIIHFQKNFSSLFSPTVTQQIHLTNKQFHTYPSLSLSRWLSSNLKSVKFTMCIQIYCLYLCKMAIICYFIHAKKQFFAIFNKTSTIQATKESNPTSQSARMASNCNKINFVQRERIKLKDRKRRRIIKIMTFMAIVQTISRADEDKLSASASSLK